LIRAPAPVGGDTGAADAFPAPRRNDAIDLLRGMAILLVVVHHLALRFRLPLGPSWLGDWLPKRAIDALSFNGYESVFVFFVISGFVIASRAIERDGALHALDGRRFYAQRARRILPLLLVLLAALSVAHGLRVPAFVVEAPQSLAGALVSALTMTLNWYEGRTDAWLPGAWDVLWSLSIEEVFYLAFPLVCLWLRGPWLVAALAALAVSLPWTRHALHGREIWQEKAYLPGMAAIAIGVLAALLARRWTPPRRTARLLAALGVVALGATFVYGDVLWRELHDAVMLLLCLGAACWLVAVHGSRRAAPRGLHWLAAMGRHSYEIYLSHMWIVLPATGLYELALGRDLRWTMLAYPPVVALCAYVGGRLNGAVSAGMLRAGAAGGPPGRAATWKRRAPSGR
jgi:peptidoglycan/LPS O-acetylase OafA/YrhL